METAKRADEALAAHGFDGDKLLAYAHTIARREMDRKGSTLGDRHQDLVMFLVEQGCKTAVKYDAKKSSPSYTFSSYVYDVMARRVPDFYRRKSEGFGDKRKGHDNRIVLSGGKAEYLPDGDDFSLEEMASQDRIDVWKAKAATAGMPLVEWLYDLADRA